MAFLIIKSKSQIILLKMFEVVIAGFCDSILEILIALLIYYIMDAYVVLTLPCQFPSM